MERRRTLAETESTEMEQWVSIEDLTCEQEQTFVKNYEELAAYMEYICYIEFPAGTTVDTQNTFIFGNYCLYYSNIKPPSPYKYSVLVKNTILCENMFLTEYGGGTISGIITAHQAKVFLREKNGNEYKIQLGFSVPVGTRIRVFAK